MSHLVHHTTVSSDHVGRHDLVYKTTLTIPKSAACQGVTPLGSAASIGRGAEVQKPERAKARNHENDSTRARP